MRSPEKSLFDYFYSLSNNWGYHTYDYLPMEQEPVVYPFVVISETQTVPQNTKYSRNDHIFLTLDVWGAKEQRKAVGELADRFLSYAIGGLETTEYTFYGNSEQQSKRILQDTSVQNTVFQRGHVEIEMEVI